MTSAKAHTPCPIRKRLSISHSRFHFHFQPVRLSAEILIKRYPIKSVFAWVRNWKKVKTTNRHQAKIALNTKKSTHIKKRFVFLRKTKSFMGNFIWKVNNRNIKLYLIKKIYFQRIKYNETDFLFEYFLFFLHCFDYCCTRVTQLFRLLLGLAHNSITVRIIFYQI